MSDRYQNSDRAEPPRAEPEIIPPDRSRGRGRMWVSVDERTGTRRVHVAPPGPFTIILALAILGLIALVMLIVLLSVALVWIPVVIALVFILALSVYWQRFRARLRRSGRDNAGPP